MTTNEVWLIAAVLVLGIALGFIFDRVLTRHHVGAFIVNHMDPATDLCKLELDKDIDYIEKQRTIEFDVKIIK